MTSAPVTEDPRRHAEDRLGLALVVVSTVAYATLPIFAKIAYAEGLHLSVLLALRFWIAMVFFEVMARRENRLAFSLRLRLWALGALFLVECFAYFKALETLSAAQTALIFYVYPVCVTLLSASLGIEPLTFRGLGAAVLSFAGAALTIAPSEARGEVRGILYALCGAVLYAAFIIAASRFVVPAQTAARHIAELGALAWTVLAIVHGDLRLPSSTQAWGAILGIAFLCTVVAHAAFLSGLARVGPGRAAVVSSLEVVVTVILAVLVLKEKVGLRPFFGGLLILAAVWLQTRLPQVKKTPPGERKGGSAARLIGLQ
jgi:drug/metabolite transporter (DMT)-like permease